MACQRYVTYDQPEHTFSLTPEQRASLVERDSPFYVTGIFGTFPTTGATSIS